MKKYKVCHKEIEEGKAISVNFRSRWEDLEEVFCSEDCKKE